MCFPSVTSNQKSVMVKCSGIGHNNVRFSLLNELQTPDSCVLVQDKKDNRLFSWLMCDVLCCTTQITVKNLETIQDSLLSHSGSHLLSLPLSIF